MGAAAEPQQASVGGVGGGGDGRSSAGSSPDSRCPLDSGVRRSARQRPARLRPSERWPVGATTPLATAGGSALEVPAGDRGARHRPSRGPGSAGGTVGAEWAWERSGAGGASRVHGRGRTLHRGV